MQIGQLQCGLGIAAVSFFEILDRFFLTRQNFKKDIADSPAVIARHEAISATPK